MSSNGHSISGIQGRRGGMTHEEAAFLYTERRKMDLAASAATSQVAVASGSSALIASSAGASASGWSTGILTPPQLPMPFAPLPRPVQAPLAAGRAFAPLARPAQAPLAAARPVALVPLIRSLSYPCQAALAVGVAAVIATNIYGCGLGIADNRRLELAGSTTGTILPSSTLLIPSFALCHMGTSISGLIIPSAQLALEITKLATIIARIAIPPFILLLILWNCVSHFCRRPSRRPNRH